MPFRLATFLLGVVLLIGALTVAGVQVVLLEQSELEHESPWQSLHALGSQPGSTRISARVTQVELSAGEQALFELCAQDDMGGAAWRDAFDVVVWDPTAKQIELRISADDKHLALVKRSEGRACLPLGGGRVERSGKYAVDVVWAGKPSLPKALAQVPLRARVLARKPLGLREGVLVLCAALGALLSVLSGFAPETELLTRKRKTVAFAVLGTLLATALGAVVLRLPLPGSVGGLLRGLGLASVEIGVALAGAWYVYSSTRAGLALHAPTERASTWLLAAVLCAALLNPMARWAMSVVPATGRAPIEAFISWPSGALAFAALGMAVPLAEELFFRGFVFGALRPLGLVAACAGTVLLFASVHVQQAWGNWGALLAVVLTGSVLTLLRALSGSTLVPAVAHLLYNLSLWSNSFRG